MPGRCSCIHLTPDSLHFPILILSTPQTQLWLGIPLQPRWPLLVKAQFKPSSFLLSSICVEVNRKSPECKFFVTGMKKGMKKDLSVLKRDVFTLGLSPQRLCSTSSYETLHCVQSCNCVRWSRFLVFIVTFTCNCPEFCTFWTQRSYLHCNAQLHFNHVRQQHILFSCLVTKDVSALRMQNEKGAQKSVKKDTAIWIWRYGML